MWRAGGLGSEHGSKSGSPCGTRKRGLGREAGSGRRCSDKEDWLEDVSSKSCHGYISEVLRRRGSHRGG